jgi:hypothetical protein
MILPTKHLHADRALLTIGARILQALDTPRTVSSLWDDCRERWFARDAKITYEWFILALDLLFILRAIHEEYGLIVKSGE